MKIKFQQFDCQNSDKDKEAWIKIPVNLHIRCNQYSIHNKVRIPTLSQNRRCGFRRRTLLYFKIHKFSSNCMLTRINVCHLRRLIFFIFMEERYTILLCESMYTKETRCEVVMGYFIGSRVLQIYWTFPVPAQRPHFVWLWSNNCVHMRSFFL